MNKCACLLLNTLLRLWGTMVLSVRGSLRRFLARLRNLRLGNVVRILLTVLQSMIRLSDRSISLMCPVLVSVSSSPRVSML